MAALRTASGIVLAGVAAAAVLAQARAGGAAASFRPLPLGIAVVVEPSKDEPGLLRAEVELKDVETGNVFATPYALFKRGETGRIVQEIHGLPELRYQGWARIEVSVGVSPDGKTARYTARTQVGFNENDSVLQTQGASFRVSP
jgi:hypothetical protein